MYLYLMHMHSTQLNRISFDAKIPPYVFISYLNLLLRYQHFRTLSGAGIVLRMAQLIHHGSTEGGTNDNAKELAKRPVKTFIVYAHDLVQIIAKVKSLQYLF